MVINVCSQPHISHVATYFSITEYSSVSRAHIVKQYCIIFLISVSILPISTTSQSFAFQNVLRPDAGSQCPPRNEGTERILGRYFM